MHFTQLMLYTMFVCQVINLGKSLKSFGTASLNIQWPKESAVGKYLLYLVDVKSKELQQISCSPETEINHLQLTQVHIFFFIDFIDLL